MFDWIDQNTKVFVIMICIYVLGFCTAKLHTLFLDIDKETKRQGGKKKYVLNKMQSLKDIINDWWFLAGIQTRI